MLEPDIEVTRQLEDRRYERDQTVTTYVRVEYYVGKHGPFTAKIDKTDDWHDRRDEKLNAEAAKIRPIGGLQK